MDYISFFKNKPNYKFSISEIKKELDIDLEDLKKLEMEGKILELNGKYMYFPKGNYVVSKVNINKKGIGFIYIGDRYTIYPNDLNGSLNHDLCVLTIDYNQKTAKVKKILKRDNDLIICEIRNGYPVLYGINCLYSISVKNIKNFVDGTRILVKINNEVGNLYGEFVEVIGHKDDPSIELKEIAMQKGFNLEFSDKVKEEVMSLPSCVSSNEMNGRLDLTNKLIYTIDCDDTKDMDDAISIEINSCGNYVVGIHIADVSHYVKYGSHIFNEAYERATSLYMINSVINMIPKELSNGICSLNPNVLRLTKSCIVELTPNGDIVDYKICDSVIESKCKMKYSLVNKILEDGIVVNGYEDFIDNLNLLNRFNKLLNKIRNERGFIKFYQEEIEVKVENGIPYRFDLRSQGTAETIIENLMVMANQIVATHYSYAPFLYRVHDIPNNERLKEIMVFLKTIGYKVPSIKNFDNPKTIQGLLKSLEDNDDFKIISKNILRGMKKAIYDIDNIGHFGLAIDYYTHFTSPIRRLPDLLVHMLINKYNIGDFSDITTIESYLKTACEHASFKERLAEEAEREADKLKMAEYMENHIGEYFNGKIIDINNNGLIVETTDNITGHVNFSSIKGDFYVFDSDRYIMIGKRSKNVYRIGDYIRIKVISASREFRNVEFEVSNKLDKVKVLKKC